MLGRRFATLFFSLLIVVILASCTRFEDQFGLSSPANDLPTAVPQEQVATVIAQTVEASGLLQQPEETNTQELEEAVPAEDIILTPSPTALLVSATPVTPEVGEPTPTAVPLVDPATNFPNALIQIYRPGPQSMVTSPFSLVVNLPPGPDGTLKIELVGEDGRILMRKIMSVLLPPGWTRINVVVDVEFEISGVAESGRLSVSVDDEYGRTKVLSSVDLILLSSGLTHLNPYGDVLENIIIQQPTSNVILSGDSLFVIGLARPRSGLPLAVELVTREGKILATSVATVVVPPGSNFGLFATELIYTVAEETWVQILVRERGLTVPGTVHISSIEIVLTPK